jgi:hypothetical protein
MFTRLRIMLCSAGVLAALAAVAPPAFAGPSWISVELPANPYIDGSRGAYLLVHLYHHGTALGLMPTGTAEGLVDGTRRSIPLDIARTGQAGVFAVRFTPEARGTWLLVMHGGEHGNRASAVVNLRTDGTVAGVEVPTRQDGRWTIPVPVTERDVNARLVRQAAQAGDDGGPLLGAAPHDGALYAGLGVLALLPFGTLLRRRSR